MKSMNSKNGPTNGLADGVGSQGVVRFERRATGVVAAVLLGGGLLLLGGCQSYPRRVATYQESQYRHSSTGAGTGKNVVREESWRYEQRPASRLGWTGTSSLSGIDSGAITYQSPWISSSTTSPYDPRRMN